MFILLLSNIVNGSNHAKCVSLSNHKCMTQPTLINLHPNENSQKFHYYQFAVKFDKCVGNCNTLNDLSNKICVPNKTEDLNLSVLNMITGINESKTLGKHISFSANVNLMEENVIEINGGKTRYDSVSVTNVMYVKSLYL